MNLHPLNNFKLVETTLVINKFPNKWNLPIDPFKNQGVMTTHIQIMEKNGVLSILPVKERGAPPTLNTRDSRKFLFFKLLHIPFNDRVDPQDIQDSIDWQTGKKLDGMAEAVARILLNHRMKHAMTLRWLKMGALKGRILNNDNTELINLYTAFGITQKIIDCPLDVDGTDVRKLCHDVLRHMEDNLNDENMSGVVCWCSSSFFDKLVAHPKVEKAFINHREAVEKLGGDVRNNFNYGGIKFSEYRATSNDGEGNVRKFIEDGEAHCFPLGTNDTFINYFGPPVLDGINQLNKKGLELYAMQTPDPKGRWEDIDSESDPFPVCRRPALLVKLKLIS